LIVEASASFDSEFLPAYIKLVPLFFSGFGSLLALLIYTKGRDVLFSLQNSYFSRVLISFFTKKWYFDLVYNRIFVSLILMLGYKGTFKYLDRGLFELLGGYGLQKFLAYISSLVLRVQSGFLYNNASIMIIGFITVVLWLLILLIDLDSFGFVIELIFLSISSLIALGSRLFK